MSGALPIAGPTRMRTELKALLRPVRRALLTVIALDAVATLAGIVGPQVLGHMVDDVSGAGRSVTKVDHAALLFAGALLVQALLTFAARVRGAALGEALLAQLRETFVHRVVSLPVSVVEQADLGDLLTRASNDVERMQLAVRRAAPEIAVGVMQVVAYAAALLITSPTLAIPSLLAIVPLSIGTRWYRTRAPEVYRHVLAQRSLVVGDIAESAEAGPTVEALRLGPERVRRSDERITTYVRAELAALRLRCVYYPTNELCFYLPMAGVVLLGGHRHLSLGVITAAALYVRLLIDPVDVMLDWLDQLQLGGASLARVWGIAEVPADETTDTEPAGSEVVADAVRYSYDDGPEILHGIDLDVRPGERIAIVGPSGAGKTTFGRLLAGVVKPVGGSVRIGGVDVGRLPAERLRRCVTLVTQENHVFTATLADNLRLARPDALEEQLHEALDAVDALDWAVKLPEGLDTPLGQGGHALPPGQVQQLALARLVLADPDTLVLDEATSLLDPGAARHLERSLAALVEGRTVIAIAHRLSTAFDADRVAVMEDGRLVEVGTHEDLVAHGGAYAALWSSWHD